MNGINKVILIGNLANPEMKEKNGKSFFKASLAINSDRKDKETGKKESTVMWVNIVIFGKLAEFAGEWMTKGDLVYTEGRLSISSYKDKDNIKRTSTNVIVTKFQRLNNKNDTEEKTEKNGNVSDNSDDIF